ncbi:hypothetical protein QJS10_CPA09g01193 [Acorus calamus]|uniref:Uncharacterized protein n=1 Tax=Acorus calamus TaxID=4465 RepID=A0AAV9E6M2_ACOCL|nr:hypothetical protein QJS10_CPA09g01193 [Acorus calamus]
MLIEMYKGNIMTSPKGDSGSGPHVRGPNIGSTTASTTCRGSLGLRMESYGSLQQQQHHHHQFIFVAAASFVSP